MPIKQFSLNLDEAAYQAATQRARSEGRTLETVLAEALTAYASGQSQSAVLTTHTVQRGDTLARIAREVYGDPHQYPLIMRANNLADPSRIWIGQVLVIPPLAPVAPTPPIAPAPTPTVPTSPPPPPIAPTPVPAIPVPPPLAPAPTPTIPAPPPIAPAPPPPEPVVTPSPTPQIDPCEPIAGASFGTRPIVGRPTDRPAAKHGDINLALRGFQPTTSTKGLIDMSGPTDSRAPQLNTLFGDKRTPQFSAVYRANNWDWGSNSRGSAISDFDVSVAGLAVAPGEIIRVPKAGYEIGQGYAVMVLYASRERITLKYTGEDSVVSGYAIHVDGVCVEPSLLALYEKMNAEGRGQLPALRAEQPFGRARGSEIQVAIRDTGRFMDPRVRKDWWHG